jgi:tetratricopeptide (TPR) repeat protein
LGNKLVLSSAFGSLAGAQLKMGESGRALELLEKRLGISEEIGDLKGQALAWDYRGNVHYTRGEYGLAENAFRKALELGEKANIKYYLSGFLRNLANVLLETGRAGEAEETNLRALEISEKMGVSEMVAECRLLAAKILSRKDQPAAAAALRHLLGEPMDDEQRAEALRLICEMTGDEASRQDALEVYRRLNERNPTEEYAQRIAQLENGGPWAKYRQ